MRIAPDYPRLRIIALGCWAVGSWLLIQPGMILTATLGPLLAAVIVVAAAIMFALGITFWLLGTDQQAGVVIDSKGISLNLGHSASFIAWDNIAAVGVSHNRASFLALGSKSQLGIRLHRRAEYLQSYECRLPVTSGLMGLLLERLKFIMGNSGTARLTVAALEATHRRTGYDVLIPEAQLGHRSAALAQLLDIYRSSPSERTALRPFN